MTTLSAVSLVFAGDIHKAVEANDPAKVEKLLQENPDLVNARNDGGATPLHLAAGSNNKAIIKILLDKKADVNARTKQGWSPLHWAAYMDCADAVSMLLDNGANSEGNALNGKTPLQVALLADSKAAVAILVKKTKAVYEDKSVDLPLYEQAEKEKASGNLKQAYEMFDKLVNDDPANEKYNFALAMTCMAMKEYSRAQLAFERVLQRNPANSRANVELALCLMAMGNDAAARAEFEKVRRGIEAKMTEAGQNQIELTKLRSVRNNINSYLDVLRKREKKWNFSGMVNASFFEDDNVNVGPDSDTISIAPIVYGSLSIDQLTVQQSSQPSRSMGYAATVVGSALYDCGDPGQWLWGTTAVGYKNGLDKRREYESFFWQVDTGPKYAKGRVMADIPLRMSHISIDNKSLVDMYGVHPGLVYAYGPAGEWRFATTSDLEMRDYATLNDRDGPFAGIGEMARYYYGENKNSFFMGFSYSHAFAKSAVYESNGTEWQFGTEYKLPWQVTSYGRIKYAKTGYADKEVLSPVDRKDAQRQYTIGLTKMITPWLGMDVNYQWTDNTSSFSLYQYDRQVTSVSMLYIF